MFASPRRTAEERKRGINEFDSAAHYTIMAPAAATSHLSQPLHTSFASGGSGSFVRPYHFPFALLLLPASSFFWSSSAVKTAGVQK